MKLLLVNPYNPVVSLRKIQRWNRLNKYRVWKPLGLLILARLTPPDWEVEVIDENLGPVDAEALPRPDLVGITAFTSQATRVKPDDFQAPGLVALVYEGLGRKDDAVAAHRKCLELIEKHLELHPDDARAIYLGANSLLQLGERAKGLDWARRALDMDPGESSILYNVACAYALQGAIDEAIECLEAAVKFGFGHKEWIQNDSDLDALRNHPRFQALLERLG
jgi:tetratricopeptide (TPR) repeat protein